MSNYRKWLSISLLTGLLVSPFTYSDEFSISSPAFNDGDTLPKEFSCRGTDISPPLTLSGIPEGTQSIVIVMDDPDAPSGTWIHWVVYNLPPSTTTIPGNAPTTLEWENGARQGENSWGQYQYNGACPPNGRHRYFFKAYALDTILTFKKEKVSLRKVKKAMKKHILSEAKLMAKFG